MKQRLFITGTDTGIGKTTAACTLLQYFNSQGLSTAALKPIQSGNDHPCDAERLQQGASLKFPLEQINPFHFVEPIAPHLAADKALTVEALLKASQAILQSDAEVIVIEGAGGWLVPLNETQTFADLAKAYDAEIVLVVGIRLGCLNHALLSYQSILQSGLKCYGWVANCIDPNMLYLKENIETLQKRIKAPLLTTIPYNCQSIGSLPFEIK